MLTLALPVWASDMTDYTVTVNAGISPGTICTTQSATGSASASIVGNNPGASQELTNDSPTPIFGIVSVKGKNANDRLPTASIHSDGSNLTVTATDGTTPDTYIITIQATYTWTDNGTTHSASGTTTVSVTTFLPAVSITLGSNVQSGKSITGTIALSSPASLPGGITVGLMAANVPPPNPQTTPSTPPATGMVVPSSSVTVPGNGSSVSFTVTGSSVSAFLNDVYVKASGGATSNNAYLTVWMPGPATCFVTPHDPYYIANDGKTTELGSPEPGIDAVDLKASAGITPAVAPLDWLVPSAYPAGSQVGLVQNIKNGATYVDTYANPTVIWNSGVATGTVGYAYSGWTDTVTVPACVDTLDDSLPFPIPYDKLVPITQKWSSSDDASMIQPTSVTKFLYAADYTTILGRAIYPLQSLSIKASFADWCCIALNTPAVPATTTFPATGGWSINFGGTPPLAGYQAFLGFVTVGGGGGYPITSGYTATDYLTNAMGGNPYVETPSPPVRLSFTK